MESITLRELCNRIGVTRRAVQGYEKAGLVKASARNNRGHLLYDEKCLEKICRIKLYQQLGFTIKEIQWLFNASDFELKEALKIRIKHLKEDKAEIENAIIKAQELIDTL